MSDVSVPIESSTAPVRINWRIAIACTLAMTLVFAAQNTGVFGVRQSFPVRFGFAGLGWGLWLALTPLVFAIAARARQRALTDWRNVVVQLAAWFVVPLLHGILVGVARLAIGAAPAVNPYVFVRIVISLNFPGDVLRYTLIAAVYHVLAYNAELRARDVSEARMAQRLAEARLEGLEARLHPHFLFNALNTIAALIRKDPASASIMVGQLSDLLRAALHGDATREVTLEGELALLDQYVAIQRARFRDRLQFSVSASPEALGAYVPQMILQPIVENAIHHGIGPREGPGTITLSASRDQSILRVVVRDDGVGFGSAPTALKGTGLGLRSTRARLEHLYGTACTFDICAAEVGGTVVTIDVPFHTDGPRSSRPLA